MDTKRIFMAGAILLLTAGLSTAAFAFGDSESNSNANANASASATATGGQGGRGGNAHAHQSQGQGQNQGQQQGQGQGQLQGQGQAQQNKNNNADSVDVDIDGDKTDTTITNVNTPSVNPTVVCAQAVNFGGGVLGFGGSAGFSYTDEDCNDREWARIGIESGDPEIQKRSRELLIRALDSRLADRYPVKPKRNVVAIGSSTTDTAELSNLPDWCYGMSEFGRSSSDKEACGLK
jgi:hypothetical protein